MRIRILYGNILGIRFKNVKPSSDVGKLDIDKLDVIKYQIINGHDSTGFIDNALTCYKSYYVLL